LHDAHLDDGDPGDAADDGADSVAGECADCDAEKSVAGGPEDRSQPEPGYVDGQVVHILRGVQDLGDPSAMPKVRAPSRVLKPVTVTSLARRTRPRRGSPR